VARSLLPQYLAIEYLECEENAIEADPRRGIAKFLAVFEAVEFEAAAGSILVHIVLAARLQ